MSPLSQLHHRESVITLHTPRQQPSQQFSAAVIHTYISYQSRFR